MHALRTVGWCTRSAAFVAISYCHRAAAGDLVKRSDVAGKHLKKKIAEISTYLNDRKASVKLVRSLRGYFNERYDSRTVFADKECTEYFAHLPANLQLQLAKQLKYFSVDNETSMLHRVPSLKDLNLHSAVVVCSRMQTVHYYVQDLREDETRDWIFQRHDVGHDMKLVAEGSACPSCSAVPLPVVDAHSCM
jgi:hypothetical protein|eukprot:SAG25_NODE_250_length_11019_cov_7.950092_13_plen_192_part_00